MSKYLRIVIVLALLATVLFSQWGVKTRVVIQITQDKTNIWYNGQKSVVLGAGCNDITTEEGHNCILYLDPNTGESTLDLLVNNYQN